jgi:hypothetical protein
MTANLDRHRRDLTRLAESGERMLVDLSLRQPESRFQWQALDDDVRGSFEREYQRWYSEAAAAVGQLLPGRAAEFDELYRGNGQRRKPTANANSIQDWLIGRIQENDLSVLIAVSLRLKAQLEILRSAEARLESSLFEMRELAAADLFTSELDACRELAARGFLRAAGTIAGVVLEKRLRQALDARGIAVRRAEPTLNDLNDQLKKSGLLDLPHWRRIQHLADLRNLCGHDRGREPTVAEVEELIAGVGQVMESLG